MRSVSRENLLWQSRQGASTRQHFRVLIQKGLEMEQPMDVILLFYYRFGSDAHSIAAGRTVIVVHIVFAEQEGILVLKEAAG